MDSTATNRVIDFRVRLPNELHPNPEAMPPPEYVLQYDKVLGLSDRRARNLTELRSDMDSAGVSHAVVHAEYEYGDPADALNAAVSALVAEEPDRFSGFGTVSMDPLHPMRTVRQAVEVERSGLVGISIQPSFFGRPIDDRALYPLYAKACELGLMVAVHTGVNYSLRHPIRNDHPLQLDQVASDFPEGTFIACHAGWPWTTEAVAIARKHPHVFLEFGGLSPKYVGAPHTGWETMFRFLNSLLYEQVLFGTDWPVFDQSRALDEWRGLGLKDHVQAALFGQNAQRLLTGASARKTSATVNLGAS